MAMVAGSQSTKRMLAPADRAAAAVAKKVLAWTSTSLSRQSRTRRGISTALVPELTEMA